MVFICCQHERISAGRECRHKLLVQLRVRVSVFDVRPRTWMDIDAPRRSSMGSEGSTSNLLSGERFLRLQEVQRQQYSDTQLWRSHCTQPAAGSKTAPLRKPKTQPALSHRKNYAACLGQPKHAKTASAISLVQSSPMALRTQKAEHKCQLSLELRWLGNSPC